MLYYNRNQEEVLDLINLRRRQNMIYENLNEMADEKDYLGVSPIEYVVLNCGR